QIAFLRRSDPTQRTLCGTSLQGGSPVELASDAGWHGASFNETHSLFVDYGSNLRAMRQSTVHRADGTRLGELPSVAEEPPFVPKAELARVGGGGGFYAALVRPRDFDLRKRYPVIVHVYGGPL